MNTRTRWSGVRITAARSSADSWSGAAAPAARFAFPAVPGCSPALVRDGSLAIADIVTAGSRESKEQRHQRPVSRPAHVPGGRAARPTYAA